MQRNVFRLSIGSFGQTIHKRFTSISTDSRLYLVIMQLRASTKNMLMPSAGYKSPFPDSISTDACAMSYPVIWIFTCYLSLILSIVADNLLVTCMTSAICARSLHSIRKDLHAESQMLVQLLASLTFNIQLTCF